MKKISLGKKNSFERGTFMAYACNCSCPEFPCGACHNCNHRNPTAVGKLALQYVNNSSLNTKAFTVPAILG